MPLLQCVAESSNMMPVQRAWWQGKQEATFSKQMNGRAPRNSICSGSRHSGHTASHSYFPVTPVKPTFWPTPNSTPLLFVKHSYSPEFEPQNQIRIQRSTSTLDNTNCKWKTAFRFSSLHELNNEIWFSLFHRAFFNSIMDKTPTHALFTQHYISLACWYH